MTDLKGCKTASDIRTVFHRGWLHAAYCIKMHRQGNRTADRLRRRKDKTVLVLAEKGIKYRKSGSWRGMTSPQSFKPDKTPLNEMRGNAITAAKALKTSI